MPLTADDRFAILDVIARYNLAADEKGEWKVARHHVAVDPSARWMVKAGEKVQAGIEKVKDALS